MAKPNEDREALEKLASGMPALIKEWKNHMLEAAALKEKIQHRANLLRSEGIHVPDIEQEEFRLHWGGAKIASLIEPQPGQPPISGRRQRGMIGSHVELALKEGPLGAGEIQKRIIESANVKYGMSSIYRELEDKKKYANEGGKWKLK